jgi:hypothetical protein
MRADIFKSIVRKSSKPILLLMCIAVIVVFMILIVREISHDCRYRHCPDYDRLMDKMKLTKDGTFQTMDGKLIARLIYEYRSKFEYKHVQRNNYISIFDIHILDSPLPIDTINDITLHKLATCDVADFSKMVAFTYVFNNDNYMKCINAYDPTTKKFNVVKNGISTKDVIIKYILKFGDASVLDLKESMRKRASKMGINPSITNVMITSVIDKLNVMTDEQLYNLITVGLIE